MNKQTVVYQGVSMPCWCGGNEEVFDVIEDGEVIRSFILCDQCGTEETFWRKEDSADTKDA